MIEIVKILFIIGKLTGGGAEKVTSVIASQLSKKHNVYLVVDRICEIDYEVANSVNIINLDIHSNGVLNKVVKYLYIRHIKKAKCIDVSVSMSPLSGLFNVLSRVKDKIIVSVRVKISVAGLAKRVEVGNRFCCNKSDCVLAVSESVRKDLINKYRINPKKIVTIYNPCEKERIDELRKEDIEEWIRNLKCSNTILVTHGRLAKQKGHWHLIRIMRQIIERNPHVVLLILGEGELREKYESMIKDYQLQNNIFLLGFKANPYKYLQVADIYVFPSLFEGFPNALLDAMACDLPIISADGKSGARELLEPYTDCDEYTDSVLWGEYGILTPRLSEEIQDILTPLDESEVILYKAVKTLIEDKEKRSLYSIRARNRINDFLVDQIIAEWEKILMDND